RLTSKKWKCEPTWTGRSPVLLTTTATMGRPAFSSMSGPSNRYSPGIMVFLLVGQLSPPVLRRWIIQRRRRRLGGAAGVEVGLQQHLRRHLVAALAAPLVRQARFPQGALR